MSENLVFYIYLIDDKVLFEYIDGLEEEDLLEIGEIIYFNKYCG